MRLATAVSGGAMLVVAFRGKDVLNLGPKLSNTKAGLRPMVARMCEMAVLQLRLAMGMVRQG